MHPQVESDRRRKSASNPSRGLLATTILIVLTTASLRAQETPDGEAVFQDFCAVCHEPATGGAPTVDSLRAMSRYQIRASLEVGGLMREFAEDMSGPEILSVLDFLATGPAVEVDRTQWTCAGERPQPGHTVWGRWGTDDANTRFAPAGTHDFVRSRIPGLELKWAFAFPNAVRARSQPVVSENMIFTGSQDGTVYALDRTSGCVWWTFEAKAEVRSSLTVESDEKGNAQTLYFGDFDANVYAVDATTGRASWQRSVADHKDTTITGSIAHHDGRLFVPMSSTEIISAYYPDYECCSFRGGVLALDAATGEQLWRMYTTAEPTQRKRNSAGTQLWGPSGAPVWSAPTVDVKRGLLYVGTGENYSSPANDMSDAILAMSLDTGEVKWVQQTIAGDAWNGACVAASPINCPEEDGPDFDFGAPPIVTRSGDRDIILAGQKSGMIFALDPADEGKILWQRRLGMGGFNGGVHWGMAVAGKTLVVPITDTPGNRFTTGEPRPGLHALDVVTGEPRWSTLHRATCDDARECFFPGLSAAITATDELVFAADLNGLLAVYDLATGERIWSFETRRDFDTVNGIPGRGGTIDSDGVVLAGTQLFVNSGYDKWGEYAGNVLLAFELPETQASKRNRP